MASPPRPVSCVNGELALRAADLPRAKRGVNLAARWFERCTDGAHNQEVFPMSNKNERRKLSLNRETIRTLNGAELGDIHGGTLGAIVTVSVRVCRYSDKIVRGAVAAGGAIKWAVDNAPKGDPDNPPSFVGATA
jgi:hypothetical protein